MPRASSAAELIASSASNGSVGLGITLLVVAVMSAFYCFTDLGRSPQAGIFVPGPLWFRRTVVGLSGAFALVAGIAELVRA
jgi:hypothetical protein